MDKLSEILGGARQEFYRGAGPHTPPAGFAFYAITVRVAATNIASLNEVRKKGDTAVTVTTKTWQGHAYLLDGDYIHFEFPVTSITLTNAGDSIFAYCIPYK